LLGSILGDRQWPPCARWERTQPVKLVAPRLLLALLMIPLLTALMDYLSVCWEGEPASFFFAIERH